MEVAQDRNTRRIKTVLCIGIAYCVFYITLIRNFNMYSYIFLGAVHEMTTIPVLLFSGASPFLSLYSWSREKFSVKSWFFYLSIAALSLAGYAAYLCFIE